MRGLCGLLEVLDLELLLTVIALQLDQTVGPTPTTSMTARRSDRAGRRRNPSPLQTHMDISLFPPRFPLVPLFLSFPLPLFSLCFPPSFSPPPSPLVLLEGLADEGRLAQLGDLGLKVLVQVLELPVPLL